MNELSIKKMTALRFFIYIPVFLIFLIGCSEQAAKTSSSCENAAAYEGTFTNLYSKVFSKQCISCHATGKNPYEDGLVTLSFDSSANAYHGLTTKYVVGGQSGSYCQNISYVNSSSPTTSYIMAVLSDSYATSSFAGHANCTPLNTHRTGLVNLCNTDISALSQWIQNGAQNN